MSDFGPVFGELIWAALHVVTLAVLGGYLLVCAALVGVVVASCGGETYDGQASATRPPDGLLSATNERSSGDGG